MQRILSVVAGLLLSLALAACTTTATEQPAEPAYTTISAGTLTPDDDVPAPDGDVILTLQGAIGQTNTDDQLVFDMETLEQIGLIEYTLPEDPYADRAVTYQGVLLGDVLAVAAVPDDAETLHAIALDDYTVDIPLDVTRWPVMLATRQDGERIPISDKGPVRVVFPYGQFDIDQDFYDPMWIWNLRTIEVR